jgi:Flp pilus assembly pilin Flp
MRDERGQASTEYAGILFVIVAIIAALVALSWTEVGDAIKNKIVQAVNKIGN